MPRQCREVGWWEDRKHETCHFFGEFLTVLNNQHARWRCSWNQRLVNWDKNHMDSKQQQMSDGHRGSKGRPRWVKNWVPGLLENIASSGPERVQQVIIKTREGTEDRRPSQKETAMEVLWPSCGQWASQSKSPNRTLGPTEGILQVLIPLRITGKTLRTGACTFSQVRVWCYHQILKGVH